MKGLILLCLASLLVSTVAVKPPKVLCDTTTPASWQHEPDEQYFCIQCADPVEGVYPAEQTYCLHFPDGSSVCWLFKFETDDASLCGLEEGDRSKFCIAGTNPPGPTSRTGKGGFFIRDVGAAITVYGGSADQKEIWWEHRAVPAYDPLLGRIVFTLNAEGLPSGYYHIWTYDGWTADVWVLPGPENRQEIFLRPPYQPIGAFAVSPDILTISSGETCAECTE